MPARLFLAVDQPWVDWGWLSTHVPYVWDAVVQHLELTVVAVVVGLAISLVLGVLAHLWRPLRFPVLTVFGAFYTIPSIALFALLIPITGLSGTSAEIPLIGYNVLILVRNVMVGLDAVPAEVLDAADGMGYRRFARLVAVELPLAVPATFGAGLSIPPTGRVRTAFPPGSASRSTSRSNQSPSALRSLCRWALCSATTDASATWRSMSPTLDAPSLRSGSSSSRSWLS